MQQVVSYLDSLSLGEKQVHKNLVIFPLLGSDEWEPDYLTLDQALKQGSVRVTEINRGGSVPELKLINQSELKVLVVEGEELVGAKQNRIVNTTMIIPAKTEVLIPVSCVEQGRWSYDSPEFRESERMMHASLRGMHKEQVSGSLREGRGYQSDQSQIWNDISEKSVRMNVVSDTGAMGQIYESYEDKLAEYLDQFKALDNQQAAVFSINGRIVSLEGFGAPDTFIRFFEKLVRSYALDALDIMRRTGSKAPSPERVGAFVASMSKCREEKHSAIGSGTHISFESNRQAGSALVEDDRVLHLSVFKRSENPGGRGTGFQRFSLRQRRLFHLE